jgi:predicted  nucleic acid-binding Zn-ribbon protein
MQAHQVNLQRVENQLNQAREEWKALKAATDDKQMQLATAEAAVEKRRVQLREAKSNHEYQALKEQIAASEMANSVATDEILEALEKLDQLQQKVADAEAVLQKAQEQANKTHQAIEKERPSIDADVQRLEAELTRHEDTLPEAFREIYTRVVRTKGVDALAVAQGEFCGGCNQQIPLNLINSLMLGGKPILCKSCGRMLYLPESSEF